MKFYLIPYIAPSGGEITVCTSKTEARKELSSLKKQYKDGEIEQVFEIVTVDITPTKEGIRKAIYEVVCFHFPK